MDKLKLPNLLFTPTLLQLADRSVIKPDGVIEDIPVSVDFMILTPKNNLGGHPVILEDLGWLQLMPLLVVDPVICISLMVVQRRNSLYILQLGQLQI